MLTQHLKYVTSKLRSVKFLTATAIAAASITVVPMTAQASPGFERIVTKEYSVKFDREMLQSDNGIQQVYLTLQSKAKKACKFGAAIDDDGEKLSREECTADMLEQFVENADVTTLTAYHVSREKMGS